MKLSYLIGAVALIIVLPNVTAAAGLVPCSGTECSACHFAQMGNEIFKWLIGVLFVVFGVVAAMGGFGLVTSGGNPEALSAAKSKLVNAVVGLLIVFAAWLLVDTIVRGLLKGGTGEINGRFWYSIECGTQTETVWPGDSMTDNTVSKSNLPIPTSCTGGTCKPMGITCENAASCSISPDLVDNFQAFHTAAGVAGARVTEAMPPTRVHKSVCHTNGTCIDYSKSGGMTSAEVVKVINAAKTNGLRPVYEVHTQAQKDALVSSGAPAENIKVLGSWISAPHFSIYGY